MSMCDINSFKYLFYEKFSFMYIAMDSGISVYETGLQEYLV